MWKKASCNCFKRCLRNEILLLNLTPWLNLELDLLGICCTFGVPKDYKCLYQEVGTRQHSGSEIKHYLVDTALGISCCSPWMPTPSLLSVGTVRLCITFPALIRMGCGALMINRLWSLKNKRIASIFMVFKTVCVYEFHNIVINGCTSTICKTVII